MQVASTNLMCTKVHSHDALVSSCTVMTVTCGLDSVGLLQLDMAASSMPGLPWHTQTTLHCAPSALLVAE